MLRFTDLALRRGPRLLLREVSAQIHPGQKVGVVGANGSGKSSLFALIRGELEPDAGRVDCPADWVIAHVAQDLPTGAQSAVDYVLDGDAELRRVERRLANADPADGRALAELHARYEQLGGYTAAARAARLVHGLGFAPGDETRAVDHFSGGWRVRLNLARALMCRSSLLLLDEPTNHLDLDAVIWLEEWLRRYQGTLLLVSHDRDFLDSVAGQILHLEHGTATLYNGNYSAFEQTRAQRLAQQEAAYARQQREIAHIRQFVDRFRAKASKARQAQSRLKALERMETIVPAHVDSAFRFELRPPVRLPRPLVRLDEAAIAYDGVPVLSGLRLSVAPGDRIGLLGPNGAGKTSLIRLLAGTLEPAQGERLAARDLSVGYFAQHQLEQLDPQRSPLEHLAALDPPAREADLRQYLGSFGFSGDSVFQASAPFSGGEKSRLALALLVYRRPNLLLLDEPTNHLDLEMRQALALALQDFDGGMVVVSHDRHLLRLVTDELLLVDRGRVARFDGALDDYPAWLAMRARAATDGRTGTQTGDAPPTRREQRQRDAELRRLLAPLRHRVREAEASLERLERRQHELERRLADPVIYEAGRADELTACLEDQAATRSALARAEADWLEAQEALEAMSDGATD